MVAVMELLAGCACLGVAVLRTSELGKLRAMRWAWQRFWEEPKPNREHREWLVDLVARERGSLEELEEVPRHFRELLLLVSRDELADRRYKIVTEGWLVLSWACLLECFLAGSSGTQVYLLVVPLSIFLGGRVYRYVRSSRLLPRRIQVLEQSLAQIQSAGVAGELR
jgi:hypothetical protein